ncbi:MAG: serine/threonine protein kinase [Microthrixaceae bacterium]|nr:serine/threonine protein kinase [Acidimicrobiales bacterium]MCB9403055.1 serine/threonine protein kinase [Microthrixaceae bacterium]
MTRWWVDEQRDVVLHDGPDTTVWLVRDPGPGVRSGDLPAIVVKEVRGGPRADRVRAANHALADVDHPDLLPVLGQWDYDGPGGDPGVVVALPFAAGGTLRRRLEERGTLSPGETVAVLSPVVAALDHLGRNGLIHGDLKPENVLLWADGRPVVADVSGDTPFATVGYAAPEMFDGVSGPPAARDVFSLGVVAYEVLTGRHPHPGTPSETVAAARAGVHRPLSMWSSIPGPVAAAVEDAIEPRPERRTPDVVTFLDALADSVPQATVVWPGPAASAVVGPTAPWTTIEITGAPPPPAVPEAGRTRLRSWPTRRRSQSRRCP